MFTKIIKKIAGPLKLCRSWWESEIEGNCAKRDVEYKFPAEPINTWSNLVYILVGLGLFLFLGTLEALVFFVAISLLGLGSFMYHGAPSKITAALDHAGMYGTFLALLTYAIGAPWMLMGLTAGVGAYLFRYAFQFNLNVMMGLFLWLTILSVGWVLPAVISLNLFAFATIAWAMDRKRILLGRYGHGIWHILTAIAIGIMFTAV